MNKKLSTFLSTIFLSTFAQFSHAETSSTVTVSSYIEQSCIIELPSIFNFGVIEFSSAPNAPNVPTNYAPFRDMQFNLKVKCSPGVSSLITYRTETDLSPSGITIKGIKMTNPNSVDSLDRFNSYIYNNETGSMLHDEKKPLIHLGTGNWKDFTNLFIAIQNPLARGYISPVPGVYTGTSELFVNF